MLSQRNWRLIVSQITAALNETRQTPVSSTSVYCHTFIGKDQGGCTWVFWTDESKFQIFDSNRRIFVRHSKDERAIEACTLPTVKYGSGRVMVWDCLGGSKPGSLVKIEGILKKEGYLKILHEDSIPSGLNILGPNLVFQQNNDPKPSWKLCNE